MALQLLDSFDHYNILTENWSTIGGASIDLTNTRGRTGIGACICQGEGPTLTVSALSGCVMGSGYNTQALNGDIFGVISGATRQVRLTVNSNGSVSVVTGNDPLPNLLGTSAPTLAIPGSYSYWEMRISAFGGSAGVIVRRNGQIVINLTGNTNPDGTGTFTQWYLCGPTAPGTAAQDDSYLCDLLDSGIPGQPNNDFLGPIKITALPPTADATPLQWTPNTGSTHFTQVDAIPPNLVNFVADGTTGDVDQYAFSSKPIAPLPVTIVGVQGNLLSAADSIVGGVSVAPDMGGVAGTGVALSTTFSMVRKTYDGNPLNSLPWKIDDFLTVPFGPKVTAGVAPGSNFVAVGFFSTTPTAIMSSPDAAAWTLRASGLDPTGAQVIASAPGVIAALSTVPNTAVTSADHGATWTSHAIPAVFAGIDFTDLIWVSPLFIGITNGGGGSGFGGQVYTSPTGAVWTLAGTIPIIVGSDNFNSATAIAFGAGVYVAVGEAIANLGGTNTGVASSPDLVTWTYRQTPVPLSGDQIWWDVIFAGGQFVSVGGLNGDGPQVMTSPDGFTWTGRTSPLTSTRYSGIAFGAGLYVAVSDDPAGLTMTSPDGITWTGHSVPGMAGANRVRFINGLFVAAILTPNVNFQTILTSPDGLAWTTRTTQLQDSVFDVTFG